MMRMATITSKRQLTIPVAIFNKLNFTFGQKIIISIENQSLKIEPAKNLIDKLAGSVVITKRFKGLDMDQVVRKSKKEYFLRK